MMALNAMKAMKDIKIKLFIGGQMFEVKKKEEVKEVLNEATEHGQIWSLMYAVVMCCPVYRNGNQHSWEDVVEATQILLDGKKVSKFKDLRDVKDGSVLVMKIPKHVTYEEVFPKAKQAMKPKAMKVMRKKSFMKVIKKKKMFAASKCSQ